MPKPMMKKPMMDMNGVPTESMMQMEMDKTIEPRKKRNIGLALKLKQMRKMGKK